jgi:hypothetical protein
MIGLEIVELHGLVADHFAAFYNVALVLGHG